VEEELFPTTTTNLVPSADKATEPKKDTPGTLFDNQVVPELVETHIMLPNTATNLFPSADEAMEDQLPWLEPF
jgi:hypothetical protein